MDSGLDGSNAGTALRASLLALNNPAKAQAKLMDQIGFSMIDAEGNAKGLSDMIRDLTASTEGMTEAEKVATLGKLVGTEAVSGFLALMKAGPEAIDANTEALRNSEGAAAETAAQMKDGIGGALENLSGAFESLTIMIGDQLVPYVQAAAEWLAALADKFTGLSDGTKKFIVVGTAIAGIFSAIAAGVGIAMVVVGQVIGALGTLAGAFGIAGGAGGLLSAVFTALTGPVGLAVAGIVALGVGVVALVKHFSKDALPEVDRFGESLEGVSESTKKALDGFFELSDGVSSSMSTLSLTSAKVTSEVAADMISKFSNMNKQILDGMNKRHNDQMASMQDFFLNSSVLTDEHEANILKKTQDAHTQEIAGQEAKEERIKGILEAAAKEKRALTEREQKVINEIQQSMQNTAVEVLSASEMEQKIIMERLKETASILSAQQAAEVVKNSAKQRDETVKEAEGQYDDTIAQIIRMRDEAGVISEEQADKLIAEAKKQRDGTVMHAENMHSDIVKEAKEQAGEHVATVDWETGEILSKWQVFKKDLTKAWDDTNKMIAEKVSSLSVTVAKKFAEISSSIREKMDETKSTMNAKWKAIVAIFESIDLKQIGIDIISGLIKGISSKIGDVKKKVEELASKIPQWAKKILGIHSPSRVMAGLGVFTGQGLANGISSTASNVKKAITDVTNVITNVTKSNNAEVKKLNAQAQKDREAIQKENAKKSSEISTKAAKQIQAIQANAAAKRRKLTVAESARIAKLREDSSTTIRKNQEAANKKLAKINDTAAKATLKQEQQLAKDRLEAIKSYVSDKKSLDQLSIVAETEVWNKAMSAFKLGTKERIEAQKEYQKSLKTVNDEIVSVNEEYAGKMQTINDNLAKNEQALTDEYAKAFSSRISAITGFAGMFDKFEANMEKTGGELINNLYTQVQGLTEWRAVLNSLWSKIDNQALMEQLEEMGPNALGELKALNTLSESELTKYSDLFNSKFEHAREQAESELRGLKKGTEEQIKVLRDTAAKELDVLNKEWQAKIKLVTGVTKTEFKSLNQIGKDAISGLMSGMASMEGPLQVQAKRIADSVSSTIKNALKIKSPSRVLMGLGEYAGEGLALGLASMQGMVTKSALMLANAAKPTLAYDAPTMRGVNNSAVSAIETSLQTQFAEADEASRGDIVLQVDGYELARVQQPQLDRMQGRNNSLRLFTKGRG